MGDHAPHGGEAIGATPDRGEPDAEALAFGRWLFAQQCTFVRGIQKAADSPETDQPEIAFVGRSNVGKSSLVNALTGRTTLARTSKTPGRTQEINFFDLGGRLMLADLPGYGYAEAAKSKVKAWTGLVRAYLRGRPPLRRVCVLVDARHGLKSSDADAMTLLDEAAVPYQAVLTKADAVAGPELDATLDAVRTAILKRPAAHPWVCATSSRNGMGIEALRGALAALASS